MQHGRGGAVGRHELARVEGHLALLQVPVGPHRPVAGDAAVGLVHVEPGGQVEHRPQARDPGPDGDHDLLGDDVAGARVDGRHRAGAVALEARHLDAGHELRAGQLRLAGEPVHRLAVEREPAAMLVQAGREPLRAPVGIERAHVRGDLGLAGDQLGVVADPLVALVDLDQVRLLGLRAQRDVAGAVVVEGGRIGLPDLHAGGHQLAHRRLEVVVAHDAAGDARGAGGDAGLVHHEHPLATASQVPRRREPVDPRADHEHAGAGRHLRHAGRLYTNSSTAARLAPEIPASTGATSRGLEVAAW